MTQILEKKLSPSRECASKTIFAAFKILKDAGGSMPGNEIIDKIRNTVELTDWEKHQYNKTGYIRWESIFHFYSIDCIKAGFLRKITGVWYLTDEGEKAMAGGALALHNAASKAYKEWAAVNKQLKLKQSTPTSIENEEDGLEELEVNIAQVQKANLEQLKEQAFSGIRDFLNRKNPYEFQEIVSYLLGAMGYFISHVADKGPDGGMDIIAYNDPLGTKEPRLIVQVKHRPNDSVPSEDIQKLVGTMKRNSDVGIFVTSGQFSKPARTEARTSHKHIELIDFGRFIQLWQEYYNKMSDEQKNVLPLYPIYFLGSNE